MKHKTAKELIAFEKRIVDLFEEGRLPYLIHLSGGNEEKLINIFNDVSTGDYVFSNHRSHYHYLLAGGSEERLEKEILAGNSMFIFDNKINFLTSSILAGTAAIAAGVALSLKMEGKNNKVWCFLGDGAEEEGHFYEAVRFVSDNDLPCKFIIEDNNRSVDTVKEQRRGVGYKNQTWPKCVFRYHYKITYPHAGTGSGKMVKFILPTSK